ncbi:SidA/IucD/PvdA family monooxygenase [Actinokineospora sp. NBRC 105648]|uniref:lysine N(6)-hydroxylase/L-ornithine N(5)-oxygenase family protein n=1 Tax=Actinokineospora sp. NBRC 105648 TaxID=3032206 RepID=UPI0024A084D9|nr:SidA/IucD/PvdA family monooxygenase [Actinokineospora sp. NBRC 105648]GLZ38994.1 lysine 6-monooxygenase [Actinokineospora sp. NBRC 105648]
MLLDLVGIGIGPFNLSLAALAARVDGLAARFLEREPEFRWHPGLLIEGTTLQVPFLADLVTLVDPTHPLSFLAYLRDRGRLFPFYFAERFHIPRAEYDDYCRWAARQLPSCVFDQEVHEVQWSAEDNAFAVRSGTDTLLARNVVLGVGTEPIVPEPLAGFAYHSADYLSVRDRLVDLDDVTVVGSGQSGAEVFLDLLRRRGRGLRWITRTPAFAPMEYSRLGLEQFTPDYARYFHGLPEPVRDRLVPTQWQLYKGISAETIAEIHDELYRLTIGGQWPEVTLAPGVAVVGARADGDRVELTVRHEQQQATATVRTSAVVCATGYAERDLEALVGPLAGPRDDAGRITVDADFRVGLRPGITGSVFVQNAERHTHGVGAPDLGLAAWRAATILNAVCGRAVHPLPDRTAYTTFGLARERWRTT